MAIEVPRSLVEFILLGPEDDRRQLQDSPILGDVWLEFAKDPSEHVELLITPYKDNAAAIVASDLLQKEIQNADIAYLQGIVAARLSFADVLRFVVPMTDWWIGKKMGAIVTKYVRDRRAVVKNVEEILGAAATLLDKKAATAPMQHIEGHKRYIALAGLILWAKDQPDMSQEQRDLSSKKQVELILDRVSAGEVADKLRTLYARVDDLKKPKGVVWTISLNRRASPALTRSVPAVKADAASTLFTVNCREIVWAVIDSGVDATHPAFGKRIKRSFDFTTIRDIISLDNDLNTAKRAERIDKLLERRTLMKPLTRKKADGDLKNLAQRAKDGRSIDWEIVERLVEINPQKNQPLSNHGTHVAGIIGAAKLDDKHADAADGMCPNINIYDFRVLAPTMVETEFAIIAALQYIRYINERNSYITIHGANLSLSIPHDVRNYACGRTPICNECERLVNSGVAVVAAAGNRGYQNFETKDGLYESYAAFSITDPGNADGVITVGATHRYWPHTYGVSFFSSRGPTGDGRVKPDLVAPGERIRAPLPKGEWGDLDGTSMAAPHVSGAAAMLMARYSELIGQPRRIKQILCQSATDLGREKTFQGHGMLDVLRAFQSV